MSPLKRSAGGRRRDPARTCARPARRRMARGPSRGRGFGRRRRRRRCPPPATALSRGGRRTCPRRGGPSLEGTCWACHQRRLAAHPTVCRTAPAAAPSPGSIRRSARSTPWGLPGGQRRSIARFHVQRMGDRLRQFVVVEGFLRDLLGQLGANLLLCPYLQRSRHNRRCVGVASE